MPNLLTIIRLVAAPLVLLVFFILPRPGADIVSLATFTLAAMTDYADGYFARRWGQTSMLGQMLDPIADKAMVMIALLLLVGLFALNPWISIPATFIILREVMVAGMREYLGQAAQQLAVSRLAKWKTAVQMVAIFLLLVHNTAEAHFIDSTIGMDSAVLGDILAGIKPDTSLLRLRYGVMLSSYWAGIALLWLAGVLTLISGFDYLRKSLLLLKDRL